MKKIYSILTALLLLFSFVTIDARAYSEDETDFPCSGVIEEVSVKILYSPFANLVATGEFKTEIGGTVLLITYPNGEKEILTVERNDGLYSAGNFSAKIWKSYDEKLPEYGFVKKTLYIYYDKLWGGYIGEAEFVYLYLPSFDDIINIIHSYLTI